MGNEKAKGILAKSKFDGFDTDLVKSNLYETIETLIELDDRLSWGGLRNATYQSLPSEIRKGDKDLQLSTIIKIANYLEVDFNTLLGDVEMDKEERYHISGSTYLKRIQPKQWSFKMTTHDEVITLFEKVEQHIKSSKRTIDKLFCEQSIKKAKTLFNTCRCNDRMEIVYLDDLSIAHVATEIDRVLDIMVRHEMLNEEQHISLKDELRTLSYNIAEENERMS